MFCFSLGEKGFKLLRSIRDWESGAESGVAGTGCPASLAWLAATFSMVAYS